jgi:hypothetical protein
MVAFYERFLYFSTLIPQISKQNFDTTSFQQPSVHFVTYIPVRNLKNFRFSSISYLQVTPSLLYIYIYENKSIYAS